MESTVICVDNSEYSRNGDFLPSRLSAQQQTVYNLIEAKLAQNPESNVALLTMGGTRPKPLTTLTRDQLKLQKKLFGVDGGGETRLFKSIQIARLILKHRESIRNRMRIVVLLCTPIQANPTTTMKLQTIAKEFKKEKIKLDVFAFGSKEELTTIGQCFAPELDKEVINYFAVDVNSDLLAEVLTKLELGGANSADNIASESSMPLPDDDPSLALAIKLSLMELTKDHSSAAVGKVQPKMKNAAVKVSKKANVISKAKAVNKGNSKLKGSLRTSSSSKSNSQVNLSDYLRLLSLAKSLSKQSSLIKQKAKSMQKLKASVSSSKHAKSISKTKKKMNEDSSKRSKFNVGKIKSDSTLPKLIGKQSRTEVSISYKQQQQSSKSGLDKSASKLSGRGGAVGSKLNMSKSTLSQSKSKFSGRKVDTGSVVGKQTSEKSLSNSKKQTSSKLNVNKVSSKIVAANSQETLFKSSVSLSAKSTRLDASSTKLNKSNISTSSSTKLNKSNVSASSSTKLNKSNVSASSSTKLNKSNISASSSTKLNKSNVSSSSSIKLNKSKVSSSTSLKNSGVFSKTDEKSLSNKKKQDAKSVVVVLTSKPSKAKVPKKRDELFRSRTQPYSNVHTLNSLGAGASTPKVLAKGKLFAKNKKEKSMLFKSGKKNVEQAKSHTDFDDIDLSSSAPSDLSKSGKIKFVKKKF